MKGIAEAFFGMVGDGIHGEIPTQEVFRQVFGEGDFVGMAAVGILPVYAVGCHFIVFFMQHNGDGTVLDACVEGMVEKSFRFFRQGGSGDIPVLGDTAQNGIADTAADDIGFVAAFV